MRKDESSFLLPLRYFGSWIGKFGADVVDVFVRKEKHKHMWVFFDFLKCGSLCGGVFCGSGPVE